MRVNYSKPASFAEFNFPNEMFKPQKRFREREDVKYFGKPVCVRRFAVSRIGFYFLPRFSLFFARSPR